MYSVAQATDIILAHARDFGAERVSLTAAAGRVLAQPLVADRDFPPFTRVAMDGIAIRYEAYAAGRRHFRVEGVQAAGAPQRTLADGECCIEVMTGAVLPAGADTVVRYEDVLIDDGLAIVRDERVRAGQHAQARGTERRQGEVLVPAGRRLSAAEIGVAATVGREYLPVGRLPRTVVIYTGDELVGVGAEPLPHQIRASNVHAVAALLRQEWGMDPHAWHLPDDPGHLRRRLAECLDQYELMVLSGGVSKGKFDFTPATLREAGVEQLVHQVAQRPGKPFWFGRGPQGQTIFALPGNPVAALMCAVRYLRPWLRRGLGLPPLEEAFAALTAEVAYRKPQTYFLPVTITCSPQGQRLATPREGLGSGDLANLADADGFLELPPEPERFAAGEAYRFHSYRL